MEGTTSCLTLSTAFAVSTFNVDSETYRKILSILNRNHIQDLNIIRSLTAVNIPVVYAWEICDQANHFETADTFVKYLTARNIELSSILNTNIFSVLSTTSINLDFIKWLSEFTWDATGKGELLLATFLKNTRRTSRKLNEKGDIIVENRELEIKGEGSRLRGYKGYGIGSAVAEYWRSIFLPYQEIPEDTNIWNLTKTGFGVDIFGTQYQLDLPYLIEIWKIGLQKLYLNAALSDFSFVDDCYTTGALNRTELQNSLLLFSLEYYFKTENIEQLLLGKFSLADEDNKSHLLPYQKYGQTVLITQNDIKTREALQKIRRYTLPDFGGKSGPQGAAVALFV
jgi:hypothetical protein